MTFVPPGDAEQGERVHFDRSKMAAFLQGYESKRTLDDDEKRALPVILAKAAVIFWLLRLNVIHYNRTEGRTGDNIMVKNPDLMKRLAAYHWSHVEKAQNTVFVLLDNNLASQKETQIAGVFSNITQAEQARNKLSNSSDFIIKEYTLDQLA